MRVICFDGDVTVSSLYGARINPLTNKPDDFHKGVDFAVYKQPEKAANTGRVVYTGWDNAGGNWVLLAHDDGTGSRYFHLDKINVSVGQRVERGKTVIGISGNTGANVTGYHAHIEWLLNWNDRNSHVDPLPHLIFQTEQTMENTSDFVTVQAGWGLSHVAVAAGLPATSASYEHIYALNAGHRGSTNWRSLNDRMGAGDVLRVRAVVISNPVVQTVANDKAALEQQLAAKEVELAQKLEEAKITDENERAKLLADFQLKISKLEQERDEKIAVLNSQLQSYQEVLPLTSEQEQVVETFKLNIVQNVLTSVSRQFERVPSWIRPMAYLTAGTLLFTVATTLLGFDWVTWAEANPGAFSAALATLGGSAIGNQVLFIIKRVGEGLQQKATESTEQGLS